MNEEFGPARCPDTSATPINRETLRERGNAVKRELLGFRRRSFSRGECFYGLLLSSLGRSEEAVVQLQRARELDPFSGVIQHNLARALVYARQFDRAIEEGRKTPENSAGGHRYLAEAYAAKGMAEQAVPEWAVRRSEAQNTIAEMKVLATERYVAPSFIAYVYAALGDKENAFEWLEKAYADHSWDLVFLGVNPVWDHLRSDPRFADLLRRLHLAS